MVNFSPVELDAATKEFWVEVRAFFDSYVTPEVHEEERRTGNSFVEPMHRAMGERGWVAPRWSAADGGAGLDAVRAAIIAAELTRADAPARVTTTTLLPAVAIRMFGNEQLKADVLAGVAAGAINIALGYTEPDCGSDLAAARTRAIRRGDEWAINGQKMFCSGAQCCQYCFCLTRTNPDAPKHRGLTVFLVPLDLPGVEIRPIFTVGGERTNFVHFDDVRIPDHYRIGPVDEGWRVMSAPLAQEHGIGEKDDLAQTGQGATCAAIMRRLLNAVVAWLRDRVDAEGRPLLADPVTRERLARVALDIEVSEVTPGPMGRVIGSDALVRAASDLLELVGPAGLLPHGSDGAVAEGIAEYAFRFAPGTAIYGGTTEIHRNLIAEHSLGLPRSTPRSAARRPATSGKDDSR
jgi:alkylation response protein AidB-like acyl-CoA dehydrogenase